MTFPITIVDNFFEDPDAIVEQALSHKFYNPDVQLAQVNVQNNCTLLITASSITLARNCSIFIFNQAPDNWTLQAHFQKIQPFTDDKWDKKNRGWIHQDIDTWFGGIVYLTKDPEPDTGTSIYKAKNGYTLQYQR